MVTTNNVELLEEEGSGFTSVNQLLNNFQHLDSNTSNLAYIFQLPTEMSLQSRVLQRWETVNSTSEQLEGFAGLQPTPEKKFVLGISASSVQCPIWYVRGDYLRKPSYREVRLISFGGFVALSGEIARDEKAIVTFLLTYTRAATTTTSIKFLPPPFVPP